VDHPNVGLAANLARPDESLRASPTELTVKGLAARFLLLGVIALASIRIVKLIAN
jgi:hypothetical protein